jgi:preprotein translocase subunit YajC
MGGVIFLVVMLLLAWMVVILPQQRRVRAHRAVVATLHEGDEVMTTSGILGTINSMEGDILQVEVAPGVELRVVRGAIARRMGTEAGPADADRADRETEVDAEADAEAASAAEE